MLLYQFKENKSFSRQFNAVFHLELENVIRLDRFDFNILILFIWEVNIGFRNIIDIKLVNIIIDYCVVVNIVLIVIACWIILIYKFFRINFR